ncbi:MAG: secretin and TonB N-terminal domain-containing protein [Candidatus Omnitrophica bacterium]|nr:secretin and TonB N-terminal domain-containing protein [Candidatus Omnitrophota bacterium]
MIKRILILIFCLELILYPVCFAEQGVSEVLPEEEVAAVSESPPPAPEETAESKEVIEEKEEVTEEEEMPELMPGYVTVNFKGADIRAVLNYLSDVGGVDIVPAPDVEGPVTLKLTNKSWETALDIIVRNYGFAYEREGGIIRVVTIDSLKMEELSTEVVKLNYAKSKDILETIKDMLSERGKTQSDSRTNTLVVTDIPTNIYKIKQVIAKLDRKTPQIMIEAKIIETILGKNERLGIDWNMKVSIAGAKRPTTLPFNSFEPDWGLQSKIMPQYFPVGTTGTETTTGLTGDVTQTAGETGDFPISDSLTHFATRAFPFVDVDAFTFGTLDFSQFSVVLEYLKQRSDTEIVSNPRITTLNNKEAKIMVGRVYNFPTFTQIAETGRWVITGYEAKELGIKLLVTPNVNEKGEIVVRLKPEISNYLGMEQISVELSAPIWSTREADTEVMVRDGDTIFIGGLIKENTIERDSKFPILGDLFGDLPFIGHLVKHKVKKKEKTELIFFITVHIVKDVRELTRLATTSSEVYVPMGREDVSFEPAESKKAVKTKKHKPWFDFRKK